MTTKRWLDDEGSFLFGKHKGEQADEVDTGYLRWILETVEDVEPGCRNVLVAIMKHKTGEDYGYRR